LKLHRWWCDFSWMIAILERRDPDSVLLEII
jgi:hypothetical protein